MAYLPESQLEKDKREQAQGGDGAQPGPQISSGQSGVITGASQQASQNAQAKGPTKSGSWTNLNQYLDANKPQAAQLGGQVAGNVANQAEQAKTQVGQVQNTFNQKADEGSVKLNQDVIKQATTDPTKFVQNQQNVQSFAQMRDAQYKGPKDLTEVQGYTDAQSGVNKAHQNLQNTQSEAGRFSLVQDQFGKPTYSRGQQRLDQLFLQNSPEARQQIQDVNQRYQGIESALSGANQQAQATAQQRAQETTQARDAATSAIQGAKGQFEQGLNQRTDEYRKSQEDLYKRLLSQTGAGGQVSTSMGGSMLDADVMAALGLRDGENLYNVDLSQFTADFNPNSVNAQNVATADDYAKYSALAQLSGQDPTLLYDPKMAGTAGKVSFDQNALRQQVDSAGKQYQDHVGQMGNMQNALLNLYNASSGYSFQPVHGREASVDDLRTAVDSIRNETINRDWLARAERGEDTGAKGDLFRQLRDYVDKYDQYQPNRTVSRKG